MSSDKEFVQLDIEPAISQARQSAELASAELGARQAELEYQTERGEMDMER